MEIKTKMNSKIKEKCGVFGVWTIRYVDESTGKVVREEKKMNHIPDVALAAITAQMANKSSTTFGNNLYIVLGTNSTAAGDGDTQLGTEVFRKSIFDTTAITNMASFFVYLTAAEVSGPYRELGLMGDGNNLVASGVANSGVLYSRVVQTVSPATGQGVQFQYDYVVNRA